MSSGKNRNAESSAIQTFLRIRPSKSPSGYFSVDELDRHAVVFKVPDKLKADYVNNSKLEYRFMFSGILDPSSSQERVFSEVGVAAVNNVLEGYNSTIFAYGQTGSGKTYTLTGGDDTYKDRGIIPRAISMLYKEFRAKPTMQYKIYVSYLEIYNEQGYDLLDPSKETKRLEDLPKVRLQEDDQGNFHLKGLAMHVAETEEDALNLLFMGDTNRAIASTSMNEASSRSHCIFSLSIEAREAGAEKVRRSKLHLVDLAGSERVAKSNSTGSTLTEATYINKSLFFLEMVIVALYEKATRGRTHVPYRNSLMTSVLRDSLGGNCKTIMVATINPEPTETDESLSTCKFAQRVARIENNAMVNEEQDPSLLIKRLKNELLNLREEVTYLKGEAGEGEQLTPLEQEDLVNKVRAYCDDISDATATLNLGALTLTKIKATFSVFRTFYRQQLNNGNNNVSKRFAKKAGQTDSDEEDEKNDGNDTSSETILLQRQVRDLKALLVQRDNEINILVNMVKKGKTVDDIQESVQRTQTSGTSRASTTSVSSSLDSGNLSNLGSSNNNNRNNNSNNGISSNNYNTQSLQQQQQQQQQQRQQQQQQRIVQRHLFNVPPPTDIAIFEDAAASFEWFRERCALNKPLAENKDELRRKMDEAKLLGERAAQTKNTISYLKSSIEALRREKALERLGSSSSENAVEDVLETPEEVSYRRAIEQEKDVYKDAIEKLKTLKPEIEMLRKLIEKNRATIDGQFNQWYDSLHRRTDLLQQSNYNNSSNNNSNTNKSNILSDSQSMMTMSGHYQTQHLSVASSLSTLADAKDTYNVTANSIGYKAASGGDGRAVAGASVAAAKSVSHNKIGKINNTYMNDEEDVDDDINAFYQAKEEMLRQRGVGRSG